MNAVSQGETRLIGFGVFEVDRDARELRKQGRRIRLQEQPFRVLCALIDRAGQVVTREELRQQLWPSSIYVDFDHGLNNAIGRLREALDDQAASPRYIETLPRIGYRFIYPIQAPPAEPASSASTPEPADVESVAQAQPLRWRSRYLLGGVAIAAMTLVAMLLVWRPFGAAMKPVREAPAIVVLPFASLSADADDEYFAEGLSEELLNQLARIKGLKVLGRTSSFYFKDRNLPPSEIASALGVSHVLEGSVRRAGARMRIAAQLTNARTGLQVWSETYDRAFNDIFAVQDEIALAVASNMQVQLLESSEAQLRSRGTRNAEAYRLFLVGTALLRARGGRLDPDGARRAFEQAIALDPGYAAAHAGMANYYFQGIAVSGTAPEEGARLGRAAAERAMALDPQSSEVLRTMANFEMVRYRFLGEAAAYRRADALFRRAIAADPTDAFTYFDYGRAIQWTDPARALELFDRSTELDPLAYVASGLAALAMSRQGMQQAARVRFDRITSRIDPLWTAPSLAGFEAYLGHLDQAAMVLTGQPTSRIPNLLLMLWGVQMSLGDREAADEVLRQANDDSLSTALRTAARLSSSGRHDEAFRYLDGRRGEFPTSKVLDVPTARLALIAGDFARARAILEQRLPDLAAGSDPITTTRVLPGLDLVLAWSRTGRIEDARQLLNRIEAFLGGPQAPRLPLFTVQRARAYALMGRYEEARAALERSYHEGFRMNCVLDMSPHALYYVDCVDYDPAFTTARKEIGFDEWLGRIRADNQVMRARLAERQAARNSG